MAKTGKGHPFIDLVEGVLAPTNVESIAQLATSICKDKRSRSRRFYKEK